MHYNCTFLILEKLYHWHIKRISVIALIVTVAQIGDDMHNSNVLYRIKNSSCTYNTTTNTIHKNKKVEVKKSEETFDL